MSAEGEIYKGELGVAAEHAQRWMDSIPSRGVHLTRNANEIKAELGFV